MRDSGERAHSRPRHLPGLHLWGPVLLAGLQALKFKTYLEQIAIVAAVRKPTPVGAAGSCSASLTAFSECFKGEITYKVVGSLPGYLQASSLSSLFHRG